jgi:hypothetical protein
MTRRVALAATLLALASCAPADTTTPATTVDVTASPDVTEATTTTVTTPSTTTLPANPDLGGDAVWFAPLPPMPTDAGRPFTGSDDFMDLFQPGAPWEGAAAGIQVFKLYGEWVAYHATPDQLRTAVEAIRDRGLALGVEAGPLDPPPECGNGIEGFAGTDEGALIANRIMEAGGRIDVIALDEPLYFASVYDGEQACHWDPAHVAAEVGEFITLMRSFFPDVVVGDIEPTPDPTTVGTYTGWLETFREVNGYDLAFLHLDVDWSRDGWPASSAEIVGFGTEFGVPIGIIFTGNHSDPGDDRWIATAGERVKEYLGGAGEPPPHVIFQSWMDHPDRALPEDEAWTFTSLVHTYLSDPSALGFTEEMLASNIALGRPVQASAAEPGAGPERVVDGDAGTHWSAGGGPPQWVEITLDGPSTLTAIRLTPAQFPAGETTHRVTGWIDGDYVELAEIVSTTSDGEAIDLTASSPWQGVERIRVETSASPSWVAWYEIEVFSGP